MANNIETLALRLSEKIAEKLEVYVVDVSYKKEKDGWFLRLFIDKPNGVGIDDCERFSKAFEEEFDKIDPIEENYCLEVSSPGVERKLTKEREFKYYLGRAVDVKLYEAIDGMKEFTGSIENYQDKTVTIKTEDKIINIPQRQAVYIKLHFEW